MPHYNALGKRVYNEMHESVEITPVTSPLSRGEGLGERVPPCISLYTPGNTKGGNPKNKH
jgi:hypothetical protein